MDMDKMAFLGELREKISNTAKKAVDRSNEFIEVTKLNVSIADAQAKRNKVLQEIGKIVYDSYKTGSEIDDVITKKCHEIDEIDEQVVELKEKVASTKKTKKCEYCGVRNDIDAAYCNKCGEEL